jgi:CheY-like chemotaxis protein
MYRVLIVDDLKERREALENLMKNHAVISAESPQRAMRLLLFHFDIIFLDFDLQRGGFDGADVAEKIQHSVNSESLILIHSQNQSGHEKIKAVLPDAVSVPFSQITKTNQVFKKIRNKFDSLKIEDLKISLKKRL